MNFQTKLSSAAPTWHTHKIYNPTIKHSTVIDWRDDKNNLPKPPLRYNHMAAVAYRKGLYIVLWCANTTNIEGAPGHSIYMKTSTDGINWGPSTPCKHAFSGEDSFSLTPENPPWGDGKVIQTQPTLFYNTNNVLMSMWTHMEVDPKKRPKIGGVYVSKWNDSLKKWSNTRYSFSGKFLRPIEPGKIGVPRAHFDLNDAGTQVANFRVTLGQDPIILRSGRILAPLIFQSYDKHSHKSVPKKMIARDNLWRWRIAATIYSDDNGLNWEFYKKIFTGKAEKLTVYDVGTHIHDRPWGAWEPSVWETSKDNEIIMIFRTFVFDYNEKPGEPPPEKMIYFSKSIDGGETWNEPQPIPIETVSSRKDIISVNEKFHLMVYNDWIHNRRKNLSLFFLRGDGVNFIPGIRISGDDNHCGYPLSCLFNDGHNNKLLIAYSFDMSGHSRSIRSIIVDPAPDPNTYYLLLRKNIEPSEGYIKECKYAGENNVLQVHGLASVGVDVPANNRSLGDKLELKFDTICLKKDRGEKHKNETGKMKSKKKNGVHNDYNRVLLTIGDANDPAWLYVTENNNLQLKTKTETKDLGDLKPEWKTVYAQSAGDYTRIRYNGKWVKVKHKPLLNCVFLGNGFRKYEKFLNLNERSDVFFKATNIQSRVVKELN